MSLQFNFCSLKLKFDVVCLFSIVVGCSTRGDGYSEFIPMIFGMAFYVNEVFKN